MKYISRGEFQYISFLLAVVRISVHLFPFIWTDAAQSVFEALKTAMTEAPILVLPDFSTRFVLETEASGSAMGAVLMQHNHPIAFFSENFCTRPLRSSTYVRELHAITTAVMKWRQYLLVHRFIIFTDHKSLKELIAQVIQTPEQQVYLSKLLGYDFTIQYKTGKTNIVADALSRIEIPTGHCLMLSMPQFIFLDDLRIALQSSPEFLHSISKYSPTPPPFLPINFAKGLSFMRVAFG